jgi:hypothetical protein
VRSTWQAIASLIVASALMSGCAALGYAPTRPSARALGTGWIGSEIRSVAVGDALGMAVFSRRFHVQTPDPGLADAGKIDPRR